MNEYINGLVTYQDYWWKDSNTKRIVSKVEFRMDVCGYYFLIPDGDIVNTFRAHWEEVSLLQLTDGTYEVAFWQVSSPYVRSKTPIMVLNMTREEVIKWHGLDVWFEKEMHYIVRRKGKKFYQSGQNIRCIECGYSVSKADRAKHATCKNEYYTVNEKMETVDLK